MKLADIVNQLRMVLPKYTNLFADVASISSIVASSGVATVTTNTAHNMANGAAVTITGVETRTQLATVSKDGLVFTFTTTTDHDLTLGWPEQEYVSFIGFADSDWNDSFKVVDVPNRRTFKVQSVLSLPVIDGNQFLLEPDRADGINGIYAITFVSSTVFTISGDFIDGTYTPVNGKISTQPRITSSINIDAFLDKYTEQNVNDFWLVVEPVDAFVSKQRETFSDANSTVANGEDIRNRIVDGFTVYIVAPTADQLTASQALDVCKHDLLLPMMRSLYGVKFPSGLSNDADFKVTLNGQNVAAYERAFLAYAYTFEAVYDLTNDDTVLPSDTRAFRNVSYTQKTESEQVDDLTVNANLDDVPLT